jgi:hypothetical protein
MKHESILEGVALEPWRQHLLDAAAYIEEHGHCKNLCFNGKAACVGGALYRSGVTDVWDGTGKEYRALKQYVGGGIATWNDRPETTKDMAVAALIGAALQ